MYPLNEKHDKTKRFTLQVILKFPQSTATFTLYNESSNHPVNSYWRLHNENKLTRMNSLNESHDKPKEFNFQVILPFHRFKSQQNNNYFY